MTELLHIPKEYVIIIISIVFVQLQLICILFGALLINRRIELRRKGVAKIKEDTEEIKRILNRRSFNMTGFTGESKDAQAVGVVAGHPHKYTLLNKQTLTDLLTVEPTMGEYMRLVGVLTDIAKQAYEEYQFLIAKSTDETKDANILQIVSHSKECPEKHKEAFALSMNHNIDMQELQQLFANAVVAGNVIELGDDVQVVVNDGTGSPATGVSPINSGIEGGDIIFNISFVKKENLDAWVKNNIGKEGELL